MPNKVVREAATQSQRWRGRPSSECKDHAVFSSLTPAGSNARAGTGSTCLHQEVAWRQGVPGCVVCHPHHLWCAVSLPCSSARSWAVLGLPATPMRRRRPEACRGQCKPYSLRFHVVFRSSPLPGLAADLWTSWGVSRTECDSRAHFQQLQHCALMQAAP